MSHHVQPSGYFNNRIPQEWPRKDSVAFFLPPLLRSFIPQAFIHLLGPKLDVGDIQIAHNPHMYGQMIFSKGIKTIPTDKGKSLQYTLAELTMDMEIKTKETNSIKKTRQSTQRQQ